MITEEQIKQTELFFITDLNYNKGSVNKKELIKIAIKNLKDFHKLNIDKEILIKDFKGVYGLLNSYIYLLNIGFEITPQEDNKRFYSPYIKKMDILKEVKK